MLKREVRTYLTVEEVIENAGYRTFKPVIGNVGYALMKSSRENSDCKWLKKQLDIMFKKLRKLEKQEKRKTNGSKK